MYRRAADGTAGGREADASVAFRTPDLPLSLKGSLLLFTSWSAPNLSISFPFFFFVFVPPLSRVCLSRAVRHRLSLLLRNSWATTQSPARKRERI